MVGHSSDSDDGDANNMASKQPISELTKSPWAIILIAALTGTGSGTFFGRPDPFTGTMGRELEARIASIEAQQVLDDDHRLDARDGYRRMRNTENCCSRLRQDIDHNLEAIKEIRNGR